MQLPRVMLRQAVATAYGTGISFSKEPIDRAYFDALALVEEEVDELAFATQVARDRQATRARQGASPYGA